MQLSQGFRLACVLLLSSFCLALSQNPTVTCSVEIAQSTSSGAYSTNIECLGDETELVVVVQNATRIRNAVNYTYNGVSQTLGTPGFTEDSSGVWSNHAFPGIVGMGFTDSAGTGVGQLGTLIVKATVVGIVLPKALIPAVSASAPTLFSVLRFSTIQNLVLQDCTLDRIGINSTDKVLGNSLQHAAVVYADDDALSGNVTVSVSNSVFSRVTGGIDSGALTLGAISSINNLDGTYNQYSSVSIKNSNFTSNTAAGNGPAAHLSMCPVPPCSTAVTIESCSFVSNSNSAGTGGAVYMNGASITTIKSSDFTMNTAGLSGGALLFDSGAGETSLEISGTSFTGNAAGTGCASSSCNVENEGGGAMRIYTASRLSQAVAEQWFGSASLLVQDSVFANNHNVQTNRAGTVWYGRRGDADYDGRYVNEQSQLSIGVFRNTSFLNNYLPNERSTAGVIYDVGSQGLTIDNCTFTNNTAGLGSAIYSLWAGYLNITGGTIIQNCTSNYVGGGAVGVSDLAHSLIIQNASFLNNKCNHLAAEPSANGGAVWMERQLVQRPGLLSNYTARISDTRFINNRCQQGGALYINSVEHTIGPNVLFSSNRATLSGGAAGALYLVSLDDPTVLPNPLKSIITGTNFSGNRADSNGGALFTSGIWSPQISGSTFLSNSVQTAGVVGDVQNTGGAAFVSELQLAALNITTSTFTSNSAYNGGGIVVAQNDVVFSSCAFNNNRAVNEGGAIRWLTSGSAPRYQVNITASNFSANTASTAGAVQITLAGAVISGSRFDNNVADLSGGGLSVSLCEPTNSTTNSKLYFPAAGIQADAPINRQSVYIINSIFQGNVGDKEGGGALFSYLSRVISSNSTFQDSITSLGSGGAIYAQQSAVNVYSGSFSRNTGPEGGAVFTESSNLTLNGTQLIGNSASHGGAIASTLARADSRTPGLVVTELNDCTARGNFAYSGNTLAAGSGGCVSAEAVNLTVRGGSFMNNSAAANGGVIDAFGASSLLVQDVLDLEQNVAVNGYGGVVHADSLASVLISNTTMANNTAARDGGCVWAGNSACVVLLASSLSKCISSLGSGGASWIGLPSTQACSTAVIQAQLSSLSPAAVASLAASGGTGVSLLVLATSLRSSRGVTGGALAIQSNTQSGALLDQVNVVGCNAVASGACSSGATSSGADGGGLYMTMTATAASSSTCSASNVTVATVNITSSSFGSNAASSGSGGAATVDNPSVTTELQVNIINGTFSNNSAANGGALYVQGAGAFLSLQGNTSMSRNTALPSSGNPGVGSVGGCIYAKDCRGLLVSSSQLSQCQAQSGSGGTVTVGSIIVQTSGRSLGGAVMADGCSALVLDGSTISSSSAGAGGGIAIKDTPAALVTKSVLAGNSARQANLNDTLAGTIDLLGGAGGALWTSGGTASLLLGSTLNRNSADLVGGGVAALSTCNPTTKSIPVAVPASLRPYPQLALLMDRAASGCYAMSVQKCLVTNNVAQGSGGGFYAYAKSSVLLTCSDVSSAQPASPSTPALSPLGGDLVRLVACSGETLAGNRAVKGYGPLYASLPVRMSFNLSDPATVTMLLDPTQNASSLPDVPLLGFLADGSLLMPSTSPLTYAVVHMRATDAADQDVRDPSLSNLITIGASTNTSNADSMNLFGQRTATYDNSSMDFVFNGIGVKAVVGNNYTFGFSMASSLWSSLQVQPLNVTVVVPDCGDGETYADPQLRDSCLKCDGSFFAFSQSIGNPAPVCFPCPSTGACSGGAVLVPSTGLWHSAPNSTEMHQCLNTFACARSDDQTAQLQNCQTAWYEYQKAVDVNALTQAQSLEIAQRLLDTYDCYLYDAGSLPQFDPRSYLNLLCADGYGGNLCGVCVTNSQGRQTALKSNNLCSPCADKWVIYLVTAGLFLVNLLIIMIQVTAALGEQMLSSTLQFADIFSAIISHVQYLIVILKLQFNWPTAVTDFHRVIASTVSFANDAIKFASITCLSNGTPKAQATYTMGSGLVLPLILVCTAVLLWVVGWYLRIYVWYPRMDRQAKMLAKEEKGQEQPGGTDGNQIMVDIQEEEEHDQLRNMPSGIPETPKHRDGGAPTPHDSVQLPQDSQAPSKNWRDGINSVVGSRRVPDADAADDQAPPQSVMLHVEMPSLKRNQTDLRRWQLPGAEMVPADTLWFDSEAEARKERAIEKKHALTLVEKLRVLDKYMPLPHQILAVVINTSFVVYQGWVSCSLSVFNCQLLDDGQLDNTFPDALSYYANFQIATAPNGYWQLNMNQACYEGSHLTKWTPIGSIMSFVLGIGIPFMTFLPIFMNRKALTKAETQLRWGWMYIRFYYGRLPYWMSVQMLELLIFIIVQTFSGMLTNVIEQAALLQLTLIMIMIFNTCMWPLVHPVLVLVSFTSNAILIFTLGLAIIIGDGVTWQLTQSAANTAGAFIVLVNVAFVALLVFLFYKHMRDVVREGFLEVHSKTRGLVSKVWARSLQYGESLKQRSFRSMLKMSIQSRESKMKRERDPMEAEAAAHAPEEPATTGA